MTDKCRMLMVGAALRSKSVATQVAIQLFDRLTAFDAVGPYEVLGRVPGAEVVFVAPAAGPVRSDNGMLTLIAERIRDRHGPHAGRRARRARRRAGDPAVDRIRPPTTVRRGSQFTAPSHLVDHQRATSRFAAT